MSDSTILPGYYMGYWRKDGTRWIGRPGTFTEHRRFRTEGQAQNYLETSGYTRRTKPGPSESTWEREDADDRLSVSVLIPDSGSLEAEVVTMVLIPA